MPHASQIRQTGGPDVLNWTPIEVADPGSGQVRLRQAATGMSYINVYHRTSYCSRPLLFIPGLEDAGIVEAIGQEVRGLKVGDRVAYAGPTGKIEAEARKSAGVATSVSVSVATAYIAEAANSRCHRPRAGVLDRRECFMRVNHRCRQLENSPNAFILRRLEL